MTIVSVTFFGSDAPDYLFRLRFPIVFNRHRIPNLFSCFDGLFRRNTVEAVTYVSNRELRIISKLSVGSAKLTFV